MGEVIVYIQVTHSRFLLCRVAIMYTPDLVEPFNRDNRCYLLRQYEIANVYSSKICFHIWKIQSVNHRNTFTKLMSNPNFNFTGNAWFYIVLRLTHTSPLFPRPSE